MENTEKNVNSIQAEHISEPEIRLNFLQRLELKRTAACHLSHEQMAVLMTGYSDLGWAGARPAAEIRKMCDILSRHRLRFGCVTLFSLSDEAIYLYAYGFDRDLSFADIQQAVSVYRETVYGIQKDLVWMGRKKQNKLIVKAYEDAVRTLSHCKSMDIPA